MTEHKTPTSEEQVFQQILTALENNTLTQQELAVVFRKSMRKNYGKDHGTLHNLGMLAAKAGMKKETMAFVLDHRDEPQFFSAFCISKSFIKHNEAVDTSEFEEVIAELAKEGHILSKQFEFKKKVAHLGILSGILELGFSISLLPTVFKISIHNISDPRLDRKAGVSR